MLAPAAVALSMPPPAPVARPFPLAAEAERIRNAALLEAVAEQAANGHLNPSVWKERKKLYDRLLNVDASKDSGAVEALARDLQAAEVVDHGGLGRLRLRASGFGGGVPNGATPLLAACFRGDALLLELLARHLCPSPAERERELARTVDTMGRGGLHLAAAGGHVECVQALLALLRSADSHSHSSSGSGSTGFVGESAPLDAAGLTPAALAAKARPLAGRGRTKEEAKARLRRCEKLLFAKGDASIFPLLSDVSTPSSSSLFSSSSSSSSSVVQRSHGAHIEEQRSGASEAAQLSFAAGWAPGWRITMEDAHICLPLVPLGQEVGDAT